MSESKSAEPSEDIEEAKEVKDEKKKKKKKTVKSADGKSKADSRKASMATVENSDTVTNEEINPEKKEIELAATAAEPEPKLAEQKTDFKNESNEEKAEEPANRERSNERMEEKVEDEKKVDEDTVKASSEQSVKRVGSKSRKSEVNVPREIDFRTLAELKEAFHLFDINRDGVLDKEDLKFTYTSLGRPDISDEHIDKMLSEMPNPIDFDAFVVLFGYKMIEMDPEEVFTDALSKWDYEGNGMISEERIRHDLQTWGEKFTHGEVDCALEEAPLYKKKEGVKMIDYIKFSNNICGLRNVRKIRKFEKDAESFEKGVKAGF